MGSDEPLDTGHAEPRKQGADKSEKFNWSAGRELLRRL
jgi:hypothetical protein